jgi:hypothetical protein
LLVQFPSIQSSIYLYPSIHQTATHESILCLSSVRPESLPCMGFGCTSITCVTKHPKNGPKLSHWSASNTNSKAGLQLVTFLINYTSSTLTLLTLMCSSF